MGGWLVSSGVEELYVKSYLQWLIESLPREQAGQETFPAGHMSTSTMTNLSSRRTMIASLASTATLGIAGCSGGSSGGGDNSSGGGPETTTAGGSSGAVFGAYAIDGYDVTIQLETTKNVDKVTLFGPDGEPWKDSSVSTGQEQVSFNIKGYDEGEYRYAAVDTDAEEIRAELTKTYEANIQVVDVRAYAESDKMYQYPEEQWEQRRAANAPTIQFKNTGTAPGTVQWVALEGEHTPDHMSRSECETGGPCTRRGVQDLPLTVGVSETVTFEFVRGVTYEQEQVDATTYYYFPPAGTVDDNITLYAKTGAETIPVDITVDYGDVERQEIGYKQPEDIEIRIERES
jgi:hypothetical protein